MEQHDRGVSGGQRSRNDGTAPDVDVAARSVCRGGTATALQRPCECVPGGWRGDCAAEEPHGDAWCADWRGGAAARRAGRGRSERLARGALAGVYRQEPAMMTLKFNLCRKQIYDARCVAGLRVLCFPNRVSTSASSAAQPLPYHVGHAPPSAPGRRGTGEQRDQKPAGQKHIMSFSSVPFV